MPRKIDRVSTYSAADFEDPLVSPPFKLRETGYVGLDEILASLDFIKIFSRTNGFWRMPDVTGTPVPVLPHMLNLRVRESHGIRSFGMAT